ncbi:UDP-N-acetylglucosamine transporter UGNT1 [Camellia lanceoleosa]|uniref:UDP-N-acetylglucosamine transporter UGNT1 n=1 Tax=Camellia lanceoleosa TaxID=1840588 RepID=A0ACC0IEY8_9ERIC|nr:UDP-N-acetylglucosamine transporter UGNT1 [Camellia lanceoleosa]
MASNKLPISEPKENKGSLQQSSAMTRRGVYAAFSYMGCAVLLVMFNKAALSSYSFPCANVITLFQLVCSCIFLYAMKYWKIISFTDGEPEGITINQATLVPLKTLRHTIPLAISYLLYMLASMESVRGISVPMYTALRRTTVAFTMVTEYLLVGQKHSPSVVCSVAIIILGALVAGARDMSFDSYSYAIVFISNICTAIYLASVARIGKSSGLNSFGLMWCNGFLCGPILLFLTFIRGDLEVTMNFPHLFSPGFQVVMLLSCIMAFLLNYSVFLNTTLNSALTQTICGNLKDLFTVGLGWLLFGGLPFDLLNVIGQSLGFLGSCLYAYSKLKGK